MNLEEYVIKKLEPILQEGIRDINRATNKAINEAYKEAVKMYDSFVEQYYEYETKSYYRHGEPRPGTKMGTNLYRGNQIIKNNRNNPYLYIDSDGSDMAPYGRKGRVDTDFVLETMMIGLRGLPPGDWTHWEGSYEGDYFSYKGTPQDAFDEFKENLDEITGNIFDEELKKCWWRNI